MKLTTRHHWQFGTDPRRVGGITLVSPRGTIYEFRPHPVPQARPYQSFQLLNS